ncbi:hypothetical protein AYO21_03784 [Fonsecaea monophora]|uniref:Cytochrome P450 oxidoreductase n=2 Tax=Fonsecaea TaxID=40354 RepID=A0A0D2DUU0_9EURO|nr:uncharacterized protein Z517_04572 [Fonsecaea pedrosoi CBS 271.37]XP_022514001.1 hypothetical protein AYO21_03784 [Fonsecaea monophora]KAH0828225.1 Pisatin demethylase [Fonsecaea pedrosoi]KIW81546.1 hypothetical protein Z517_04572 [Fonsecaea pedrosoi CBS 271.37]OAG42049.1 hypothetical protein AYO21_03784 [Fonsecaea monophora]
MGLALVLTQTLQHWWWAILCLLCIARLVHNYSKLSFVPGPALAGVTDLWRYFHGKAGKCIDDYQLHRKYNSKLLRVGPNQISVSDATEVTKIYGLNPIFNKGEAYVTHSFTSIWGEVMPNLSSTRDEKLHARLRRPVNNAYSMSTVIDYEYLMDSTTNVFFDELTERFARTGTVCDFATWLQMYAFDVLGEITFSKRFGFLEAGHDLENMLHHTAQHMEYLGTMGQLPSLDRWFRLNNPFARLLVKPNAIVRFTTKHIHEHKTRSEEHSKPDFVTRFRMAQEKYPDVMTDPQLIDFAVTNVSAGSDTTAIILRAVFFYLLTDQPRLERVMGEIRQILAKRPRDRSFEDHFSWAEARQMPFLQACIKESLRMHPALGMVLPRVVPVQGATICGVFIPGGTEVGCNAWTVHRDKDVYGEDADLWIPERWLDDDEEKVKMLERYNFAFGAGSRTCIGRHVAMLEISKLVPEVFRHFEVELVDRHRYKAKPGWLVVQSGLDVVLKVRDPKTLEISQQTVES